MLERARRDLPDRRPHEVRAGTPLARASRHHHHRPFSENLRGAGRAAALLQARQPALVHPAAQHLRVPALPERLRPRPHDGVLPSHVHAERRAQPEGHQARQPEPEAAEDRAVAAEDRERAAEEARAGAEEVRKLLIESVGEKPELNEDALKRARTQSLINAFGNLLQAGVGFGTMQSGGFFQAQPIDNSQVLANLEGVYDDYYKELADYRDKESRVALAKIQDESRKASDKAKMEVANKAAFMAPGVPMAIVATGHPFGIWRMEYKLSNPERALDIIGTPITGIHVFEATIPGK